MSRGRFRLWVFVSLIWVIPTGTLSVINFMHHYEDTREIAGQLRVIFCLPLILL